MTHMDEHHTEIMSQYDAMIDLTLNVGHSDFMSWSSDFEVYLIVECHTFG